MRPINSSYYSTVLNFLIFSEFLMLNFEYKNHPSSSQEKSQINKSMSAYPTCSLLLHPRLSLTVPRNSVLILYRITIYRTTIYRDLICHPLVFLALHSSSSYMVIYLLSFLFSLNLIILYRELAYLSSAAIL